MFFIPRFISALFIELHVFDGKKLMNKLAIKISFSVAFNFRAQWKFYFYEIIKFLCYKTTIEGSINSLISIKANSV